MKNLSFLKGSLKGKFQGFFHQPNISISIVFIFLIVMAILILHYFLSTEKFFSMIVVTFIIIVGTVLAFIYLWRTDPTESISVAPDGTLVIKSPSRQLIPVLLGRLTETTNRPNKLIPRNVDLEGDPSNFKSLTTAESEEIVRKEVVDAVTKHPLIKSNLPSAPSS